MIDKTAIIDKSAYISETAIIGPYCVIGKNVKILDNTILYNNVTVECNTTIGKNCKIWPYASIGSRPQDLSYKDTDETFLEIGDDCLIRENVTISRGTKKENSITKIGNKTLVMACAHVGHDSIIGNNVIIANYVGIPGHVKIEDYAVIGGLAAIHQFTRIGESAMIAGGAMCAQDAFPFSLVKGDRAHPVGLNIIGLRRRGFSTQTINLIKKAFKIYFFENLSHNEAIIKIEDLYNKQPIRELEVIINFLKQTKRGIARPRKTIFSKELDD